MDAFVVAVMLAGAAVSAAGGGSSAKSADGVPIRYEVAGKGEPTVVLVHGWAMDRHIWDAHVAPLATRHRVVTVDLAGHGESGRDRKQWTIESLGEDVKAAVEAAGAREVVLVGHSMGGPVVLEAARRLPDRVKGIVLVDTLLDAEQRMEPELIGATVRQLTDDYRETTTTMANEYLFAPATPPAVRERVLRHALAIDPPLSIALLRQAWLYDPLPALREIKAPIRAVNADRFPTKVEVNRRHMPGFEVTLVPGSGHYPMLEFPEPFRAALDKAIDQVLAVKR